MATAWQSISLMVAAAGFAFGQLSPPAQTSLTIGGTTITIKYSAPSVRGRKIFGVGGLLSRDATYPVWRAGADFATSLTTSGDLVVSGKRVPKGNYTLYVLVANPDAWQLIINKETGQWGRSYDQSRDLGRVKMNMSKPTAPVEVFRIALTGEGGNKAKLTMEWENHSASVPIAIQ